MHDGSEPLHEPAAESPRRPKGIYMLPNMITLAALFGGFYAIVMAMNGRFDLATVGIFPAMVLDSLDGRVARMTNTQSAFGEQMDSLSDMVSFGAAPALVAYVWVLRDIGRWGWIAAFVYCACAALRLARFNVNTGVVDKRYFQGLPSPAAAALVSGFICAGFFRRLHRRQQRFCARPPAHAADRSGHAPANHLAGHGGVKKPRLVFGIAAGLGVLILSLVLWAVFKPPTLSQDEQLLVRTLLREADSLILKGDLLAPPGQNAFEDVQKVLQKDPENERGLELLTQIAGLLRANAEKVMETGDLAGASEIANQALLVAPEDAQVQDLLKRITETQQREANAARIAELLQKAIEGEKRNQITGAEGAYALLPSALALDASNADVMARLKAN